MKMIAKVLRACSKLRFKILGHATIKDIPTDQFNEIIESLISSGWKKIYVYDGFDAWIDYGKVKLQCADCKLIFEWDNWTEGSVEGPAKVIEDLATTNKLDAINEWRWAEYDEKP
ncbi:hypothetical protein [Alteromonas sp. a30]|uniref:hypothetical protein n=1 Tax=Alteromonas sp. a30 TaxID=2730917 RepID=UPI00227E77B3|nr:hypothetical protein [Alteromonas sp. a30]MCY7297048.1 hypothetical protein [Alteromonas sp. a30]